MHIVTHPDFLGADRYLQGQGTHEGATMVGTERKNFQNLCLRCSKNALPDPVCSETSL